MPAPRHEPAAARHAGNSVVVATAWRWEGSRKRPPLARPRRGVVSGKQREDGTTSDFYQFPGALPSRPTELLYGRTGQPQTVVPFALFGSQAPGSSLPGPDQEYSHRWPQPAGQWELPSSHFMMCCRWPP